MAHVRSGWPNQPTRFPLKRTRSESPVSNKVSTFQSNDDEDPPPLKPVPLPQRRVPSSYQPAIYSSVPNHIFYENTGPNSSCESATPTSSNGDWVSRTEDLQLATPPGGASPLYEGDHYGAEEDVGDSEVYSQEMMDAEPTDTAPRPPIHLPTDTSISNSYFFNHHHHTAPTSLPSTPLTRDSPFTATQIPTPPIPPHPHPPHHAPSLYANLAGSPVERSLSSDSAMSEPQADMRMQESPPQKKPTGGWRLAMGYRADCEKCLNRVPGHYSHIIH